MIKSFRALVPSLIQATTRHPAARIVHIPQYRSSRAKRVAAHDVSAHEDANDTERRVHETDLQYRIKAERVAARETQGSEQGKQSQTLAPQQGPTCNFDI